MGILTLAAMGGPGGRTLYDRQVTTSPGEKAPISIYFGRHPQSLRNTLVAGPSIHDNVRSGSEVTQVPGRFGRNAAEAPLLP
jgi:hypothetical protein